MTYDQFLEKLRTKQNFSFSRWGDGEFICMLQNKPGRANCDGNLYYPDLGEALRKIIDSSPEYYMGMQGLAERLYPEEAAKLRANGSEWIDADILHKASQEEGLDRLFQAFAGRQMVIIGSKMLSLSKLRWPTYAQVFIPEKNSWDARSVILEKSKGLISQHQDCVVIICAGMAANYFVDELYQRFGTQHTFIDAGSVFDPYCGRNTRKYHSQIIERLNGYKAGH